MPSMTHVSHKASRSRLLLSSGLGLDRGQRDKASFNSAGNDNIAPYRHVSNKDNNDVG